MLTLLLLASSADAGLMLGPWLDEPPVVEEVTPVALLEEASPPSCAAPTLGDAAQLPDRPDLYHRWDPARSWGTPYLVETLLAVTEELSWLLPEADPLVVGDVSRQGGGAMYGHRTHDRGVDADIGLYMIDGRQPLGGFEDVPAWRLDVEATWLLVRTLLETERVDFVLLDQSLIDAMKRWLRAERVLAEEEIEAIFPSPGTPRLWELTGVVRHAAGHRNHLHVRVRCE